MEDWIYELISQLAHLNKFGNIPQPTGKGVHPTDVSNEQILDVGALSPPVAPRKD